MDYEYYMQILKLQGKDPYEHPEELEFNVGITYFREDLLKKKNVWTGDWKEDWWHFMANNHILYGIFRSPKYHEYSKRERLVVLACCGALFATVSILSVVAEHNLEEDGVSSAAIFGITNVINVVGAVSIALVEEVLKVMATCACVQRKGETLRRRVERLGHIFMGLWIVAGLALFAGGIAIADDYGLVPEFFIAFFTNVIASWVVPTLLLTGLYHILWKREFNKPKEDQIFHITYHDYLEFKDQLVAPNRDPNKVMPEPVKSIETNIEADDDEPDN